MGWNEVDAPGEISLTLGYRDEQALADAVTELVEAKIASRIAAQDPTVWGPDAESEASIRLSWVGLAESSRPLLAEIDALRADLSAEGVDHVVLAGMGGSSLAPEVIAATAGVELVTLDTTDAEQVRSALAEQLDRTVLVVSSKSGGTVETDSHRRVYEKAFADAGIDPASRIVVVTDPGSPLAQLGADKGYRKVFLADSHVGGRYSALTAFGLVPTGLAGVDIGSLLDEAAAASVGLAADSPDNPALRLGALFGLAHAAGTEKVVIAENFASGDSEIKGFGDWAEQLIAESTGKLGKGLLPVVVESVDAPGFADAKRDATLVTIGAVDESHYPASGFGAAVSGPLGAQMLLWEYAIVVAGRQIGINPFDQPDVESAKAAARSLLDGPSGSDDDASPEDAAARGVPTFDGVTIYGAAEVTANASSLAEVLSTFLSLAPESGYVSVQAYLDRLADDAARLRPLIAAKTGLQTTFGWGPRFLHSTGQYHKGGHQNGIFLQILGATAEDLTIPDRPYTFATLQAAQARGDGSVLGDHGRPVLGLYLWDRAAGLDAIAAALGGQVHD
jgi:glucose-6-phosphate isomerase